MSAAVLLLCLTGLLGMLTADEDGLVCSPQKTFPHPEDCSRYYYCDNTNTPQVFYCSPGVHYNPDSEQCDLPDSTPCPSAQPSVATLREENLSPTGDGGLVAGQPYSPSLPNTRQFYTPSLPDLDQPSEPSLPDDSQPSDSSLSEDDGLVVGQSYSPSLPNNRQFLTPDLSLPSAPSLLELGHPSTSSLPADEEVGPEQQPFVPVFPGRGGPIFRQPVVEDRKDVVGDIVYASKTENSSESYGTFFTALQNFEKTLEEGRQKEEGDAVSDFVDVKRQAPADEFSVLPSFNFTVEPVVVSGKEEGNTEPVQTEGTSEATVPKGRCSAEYEFFARKAHPETVDIPADSEKTEQSTTSGEDREVGKDNVNNENERENIDAIVLPVGPLTNLTIDSENDKDNENTSKSIDVPTVKDIELDSQNESNEGKSTLNFPSLSVLSVNETSPLENTEAGTAETFDVQKEGNETPEKVEEIEEAKGTIIFESHSAEEENSKAEIPPEGMTKVIIKETSIL